jgi:GT2 family glycosyltransferase
MFLYLEDPDLSWRFRLLGWRVAYASGAKVAHYLGGSTGGREVTPARLYYCQRNLLRSIVKNCGSSLAWALRNYFLFSLLMVSGLLIYDQQRAVVVLKAFVWNIRNLRTTYASRVLVQRRRKVDDREILLRMFPGLPRKQPAEYSGFRRILNLLFEFSNRGLYQTRTKAT